MTTYCRFPPSCRSLQRTKESPTQVQLLCVILLFSLVESTLYSANTVAGAEDGKYRRCGNENQDDFAHLLKKDATAERLCEECVAAMRAFRHRGPDYLFGEFQKLCRAGRSAFNAETCLDALRMYKEEVRHIIWELKVTDVEACKFVLGCGAYNNSIYNWDITLSPDPFLTVVEAAQTTSTPFSVLHLTDTHVSTQFSVGSAIDCDEELCCTDRQRRRAVAHDAAGPYGDLRGRHSLCDLPMRTLKSLLRNARSRQFELVYLTGDFIPHTTWNYSFERVLSEIQEQTHVISQHLNGARILPAVGNHDDYPAFLFPTHKMQAGKYSVDKLYNALWNIWGNDWLPATAENTFKRGGYYSVEARPGLWVFSLNTVYCYKLNWWLAVNPQDPEDQLSWLINGLEKVAENGAKAHIIAHIPPGTTECIPEWGRAYQKIVSRFRNVITGQFFGHMHWDQFYVDWSPTNMRSGEPELSNDTTKESVPTGVQLSGPVATTFVTGYPSYRIMHFGPDTELLDMDNYLLNITDLNRKFAEQTVLDANKPMKQHLEELDASNESDTAWKLSYRTREYYNLSDLRPTSFAHLIEKMQTDDYLLTLYYRAMFQFREPLENLHCSNGSCTATFYYAAGSMHPVTCEMYSAGSTQQSECFVKFASSAPGKTSSWSPPSVTFGAIHLLPAMLLMALHLASFFSFESIVFFVMK